MTGVLPPLGAGARIWGSTLGGGHSTPSDFASLSPRGSDGACPVVTPPGAAGPSPDLGNVGAQLLLPGASRAGAGAVLDGC